MKKSSKVSFLQEEEIMKLEKSNNCDFELNLNFFKVNSYALTFENKVFKFEEKEYNSSLISNLLNWIISLNVGWYSLSSIRQFWIIKLRFVLSGESFIIW